MTPRLVPAQPNASSTLTAYSCHGAVTWPIKAAAAAIASTPPSRQLRGPNVRTASLTKATSTAPNK